VRKQSVPEIVFAYFHNKCAAILSFWLGVGRGGGTELYSQLLFVHCSQGYSDPSAHSTHSHSPFHAQPQPPQTQTHRRYGQRALVNENVGSLVNTLTLHKTSDLRLEAFARLLSEEWDVGVFVDFLTAQTMALQVGREGARWWRLGWCFRFWARLRLPLMYNHRPAPISSGPNETRPKSNPNPNPNPTNPNRSPPRSCA